MFVGLMNVLCCCRVTLLWPKILTIVNIAQKFDWPILFTHPSKGGKLMIISPSHLKVQRVAFRNWMQIEGHNHKWYIKKDHDIEKMISKQFGYSSVGYYFSTWNEMNHFHQTVHHHQDGVIRIKRWKVCDEDHGNWRP